MASVPGAVLVLFNNDDHQVRNRRHNVQCEITPLLSPGSSNMGEGGQEGEKNHLVQQFNQIHDNENV